MIINASSSAAALQVSQVIELAGRGTGHVEYAPRFSIVRSPKGLINIRIPTELPTHKKPNMEYSMWYRLCGTW